MDAKNFFELDKLKPNNLSKIYKLSKLINQPKIILMTATPMTNSSDDLLKLLELLETKIVI